MITVLESFRGGDILIKVSFKITYIMNKKIVLGVIGIVIIIGAIYLAGSKTSTGSKTVNAGAVLALTGYAATDGQNIKDGIELAKADLQKEGIMLNVEYYDDATDPKKTVSGVSYMNGKGIKTLFGPTWSYQVSAALPIIAQNGMTAFIADGSSDIIDGSDADKAYLIHGVSPIYQIQAPSAEWIKNNNVKKLAILTVEGTWGDVHAKAWTAAAKDTGATVGMSEKFSYTDEATTIPTIIIKAKAEKIDGIVWTGTEAGAIALVKKMQEIGYNVPVLATNYLKVALDEQKIEIKGLNLNMIESARSESFNKKYEAVYGKAPNKYAESSYDLTMIAVHASLEKDEAVGMHDYLTSKTQKGFSKNYTFNEKGDITNLGWSVTHLN